MADFWDVGQFSETSNGKTRFIKLGYASEKKGGGFYVHMDALPLQTIDERSGKLSCQFVITPPRGSFGGGRQEQTRPSRPMDDEVPF